ncbi:hypothetical protein A1Q2_00468 [Trichosporon asahii var. asahii CBS 8904]|uniref:Uncharacterized protein n=1 Tax=Trichosporon asahii var. asahii (strain CBS 8904) TaxID=1220162 RepID=K1W8V7_TRIAC|nr:hypothetical protein A1Q2_00468 [Trichosporon asahii var. asahii CBS 8904]
MVSILSNFSTLYQLARQSSLFRAKGSALVRHVRIERELGILVLKSAAGAKIIKPPADQLVSILGRATRVDMGPGLTEADTELFRLAKPQESRWLCMGDVCTGSSPTTVLIVSHIGHGKQTIDLRDTQRLVVNIQPAAKYGLRHDTDSIRPPVGATFLGAMPAHVVILPESPKERCKDVTAQVAMLYTSAIYFFLSAVKDRSDADVRCIGLPPAVMREFKLTFDKLRQHFEKVMEQIEHELDYLGNKKPEQTEILLDMLARVKLVPWEAYANELSEDQLAFENTCCLKCFGYGPRMCVACTEDAEIAAK